MTMKLSAPKTVTWWVSVAMGVLSVLGYLGTIAQLSPYSFGLAIAGLAVMLVATVMRGL